MSTPETEVQKVIEDTKETIASLEGEPAKVESEVTSIFHRYELYFVSFVTFVAGLVIGHFV